jgi:uncharacterized protein YecE (DUF72 family)
LSVFFNNIEPLTDKTLLLLIQLPYYLTENRYLDSLQNMVYILDNRFKYALEESNSSGFNDKVYDFLKNNTITLAWSVRDELKTPPIITSDQIYVRFIGDRSINDKDFGKIVKDRKKEMQEYVDIVKEKSLGETQTTSIAFNNHFAGFGPESASTFLKMMDKLATDRTKELKQNENIDFSKENKHQTSIFDFPTYKP